MGLRYRKSIKIAKGVKVNISKSGASVSLGGRGHTVNIGKNGTRTTYGIPGTGISYSKFSSNKKKQNTISPAIKNELSALGQVNVHMDNDGKITMTKSNGELITDQGLLKKIRATSQFKTLKDQLEIQRQKEIDEIIRNAVLENEQYIYIHRLSANVETENSFNEQLNAISPETYTIDEYSVPAPTEAEILEALTQEAQENVKASIFTAGRARRKYIEERRQERVSQAISEWEQNRTNYYQEQAEKKKLADAEYQRQYEENVKYLSSLISGDENTVCEIFDNWIASCELPVEMDIDYDWNRQEQTLLLDVELPSIEDLPDVKMIKTSTGNLKEKKKTQTELRAEYATLVFGLAVFISSNVLNISPAIKKILISGYTNRRDREGNINSDYIYSIKFRRELFENKEIDRIDPQEFCMSFENRCNMTSTSLFKTISPFEQF